MQIHMRTYIHRYIRTYICCFGQGVCSKVTHDNCACINRFVTHDDCACINRLSVLMNRLYMCLVCVVIVLSVCGNYA